MKKFIIYCAQRTGSTLLWKYLNEHPDIDAKGEIFLNASDNIHSYAAYKSRGGAKRLISILFPNKSLDNYLQWYFGQGQGQGKGACGFKLMYNQLKDPLRKWIENEKVSIIHLVRGNYLKIFISREKAKTNLIYHSENKIKRKPSKIHIDAKTVITELEKIENDVKNNGKLFYKNPKLEIRYEELVSDKNRVSNDIFNFLDVPIVNNIKFPLSKVNPDNLRDIIQNYDEINAALINSKYKDLLN